MSNDAKFFMFLWSFALLGIISIVAGVSYSNYLYTIRMKDCITAGYEWVHVPNYGELECRKVNK